MSDEEKKLSFGPRLSHYNTFIDRHARDSIVWHELHHRSLMPDWHIPSSAFGFYTWNTPLESQTFDGTFESFTVHDDGQAPIVQMVQGVAQRLVELEPKLIGKGEQPFAEGKIFSLYGKPGLGKTHLMNALINHIKEHAPELAKTVEYLVGEAFREAFYDYGDDDEEVKLDDLRDPFPHRKVILLDDLFRDYPGVNAASQLPDKAVRHMLKFVSGVYEHKQLAIITSNFRVLQPLLPRVTKVDPVGRHASRYADVLGASTEVAMPGKDFRAEMLRRSLEDNRPFDL